MPFLSVGTRIGMGSESEEEANARMHVSQKRQLDLNLSPIHRKKISGIFMQLTNIMGISTSAHLLIFAADVHKGRQPRSDDEEDRFKSPPIGTQTPSRHHALTRTPSRLNIDLRSPSRLNAELRTPSRLQGDTRYSYTSFSASYSL